jgi:ferredoxin/flavodoxin---NADP+ reductase
VYRIVRKEALVTNVSLYEIEAPAVARKAQPGQFVILRVDDQGERIPVTVADFDREKGTVTIVVMAIGATTRKLAMLRAGDSIPTFMGPLGSPTHVEKVGSVICIGGGVGTAMTFPVARAMREAGNRVTTIAGWRNKDLIFWRDELATVSDDLIVCTDDGSFGRQGVVTNPLKEALESEHRPDLVLAIGPAIMMKFVSLTTKPYGVRTIVSLNPIMVDGTGMCGGCRVEVGGQTKFACVDGPEFDGHQVDWDLLMQRQRSYLIQEKESVAKLDHDCRLEGMTG